MDETVRASTSSTQREKRNAYRFWWGRQKEIDI
jgi:hypothetical protein